MRLYNAKSCVEGAVIYEAVNNGIEYYMHDCKKADFISQYQKVRHKPGLLKLQD